MPGLKVLIKGMNKVIEFPTDTPMEVIEQSIKGGWNEIESISGLPMDTASRMERAKYLGFDPDDITFSGGSEQVEKIRGGELFNGIFGSHDENVAESFGEVTELLVRPNKLLSHSELNYRSDPDIIEKTIRDFSGRDLTDNEYDEVFEAVVSDRGLFESDLDDAAIKDIFFESDRGRADWEGQRLRGEIARNLGFDAVEMNDETGVSILMLADKPIRRVDAAFNPAKKGSSDLLASVAGGAVGIGALTQSDESAAAQSVNRLLKEGKAGQESKVWPIVHPTLHKIGMKLQESPQDMMAGGVGRLLEMMATGRENELTDESIRKIAIDVGLDFL